MKWLLNLSTIHVNQTHAKMVANAPHPAPAAIVFAHQASQENIVTHHSDISHNHQLHHQFIIHANQTHVKMEDNVLIQALVATACVHQAIQVKHATQA